MTEKSQKRWPDLSRASWVCSACGETPIFPWMLLWCSRTGHWDGLCKDCSAATLKLAYIAGRAEFEAERAN